VEKFGRYFRRKGWFGFDKEHDWDEIQVEEGTEANGASNGTRILVEFATAYAITKVFLPARILLSVWATPWVAGIAVGRFGGLFAKLGRGARPATYANAAGTGSAKSGVQHISKGK
jgi:hypothetical protein